MADLKAQLEIGADVSGVEAGVGKAKKAINSLGVAVQDSNSKASKSIDRYVQSLQTQAATMGKSARETELYKLALKGASDAQLKAADSAIRLRENYEKGEAVAQRMRASFVALGAIAATGLIAAAVAIDQLLKKAGDYQDMAEKFGDSAENFASLAVAAGTAGVQMDVVGAATAKLTKNLTGVDDESKDAGAAIAALGLSIQDFKALAPADQMEAVAKALANFEDGAQKTAVAMALFGKSGAELLPFLKELGAEGGRQVILTQEQIRLADEYSDRQARLRTELGLHAQALATQVIPTLDSFREALSDLAKDQEHSATAAELMQGAINAGVVIFQTIAVVASEVGFVLKGVGREIGAMSAQLVALAHLDFAGFTAISDAVKEDAARARAELDKFQARVMAIGQPAPAKDPDADREARRFASQAAGGRKKLVFNGADKDSQNKAKEEAKARLAFDLEQIKAGAEAVTNIYGNAQKIMEAQRAAGLLDDQEYYAAKQGFVRLNGEVQERELQAEIARMQRENLAGKDRIDNDRKIAEARAKLAKVQQDSTAQQIVLDTQEAASARQRAAALLSARQSAQDYYDEQERQRARELASLGQGKLERGLMAGINQIEDRYASQRRDLENQRAQLELEGKFTEESRKQYEARLAIITEFQDKSISSYTGYYARLIEQQQNWSAGANEALKNYFDETQNTYKSTEALVTNAFQGMEDALVEFVKTGKLNFKELVNSILADIARIMIRKNVTGPLANALQGAFGGGSGSYGAVGSSSGADFSAFFASAKGNVFQTPGLKAYSNKIVNSPTMFAFAKGAGLMGEAGPEAIMPLRRGPDGRLGVDAAQNGSGGVTIVNNLPVGIGKVDERRDSNGDRVLVIQQAVEATAAALNDPNSRVSRAMRSNYNVTRNR
jgi:lambda family phage tail tape measure protein